MARIPTRTELIDVQTSFRDVNEELRQLTLELKKLKGEIPTTKDVENLQSQVTRLSKTPTYLDPNDVFRGSGGAHMHGYVPDPGVTPGTAKYLREDGSWEEPPGTSPGVLDHPSLTGRTDADQHPASSISNTPDGVLIDATTVQGAIDELDTEKLARDGTQTMLGHLQMNKNDIHEAHNIDMEDQPGEAKITYVREISFKTGATGEADINNVRDISFTSAIGEGIINDPRVISMEGDHADDEAKIENLERVVFNNEITASSIENPSRIEWNVGVTAGDDYTEQEGSCSWDDLEGTMVAYVQSGAALVAVTLGWMVKMAYAVAP